MLAHHRKACLPNYQVFDEKRYFTPGTEATVVDFDGYRSALLICEDVWEPEPAMEAKRLGAEALLIINASPYEIHKQRERERVVRDRIAQVELPAVSVNLIGGQDELVFDGNSFVMDARGQVSARAQPFEETLFTVSSARRQAQHPESRGASWPQGPCRGDRYCRRHRAAADRSRALR